MQMCSLTEMALRHFQDLEMGQCLKSAACYDYHFSINFQKMFLMQMGMGQFLCQK